MKWLLSLLLLILADGLLAARALCLIVALVFDGRSSEQVYKLTQQLTGINFIFYFGTTFFETLGTIKNPFLDEIITNIVNIVATPPAFWIIERYGRRDILIIGAALMVLFQFLVAIIGVAAPNAQVKGANKPAVSAELVFICLNVATFACTWGPSAWVVCGWRDIPFTYPCPWC